MKTSSPRMFSLILTKVSPSGKAVTWTSAKGSPRVSAIRSASARWAVPLMSFMQDGWRAGIVDTRFRIGNPASRRKMESPNPPSPPEPSRSALPVWAGAAICGVIVAIFYAVVGGFGNAANRSALYWLESSWNKETRYEHGFMVPVIMIGLIAWQWKNLVRLAKEGKGHAFGLPVVFLGIAFFVVGYRCGQARFSIAGLPMILW